MAKRAQPQQPPTPAPTPILIVDDEPIILKSLAMLLGGKKWEVVTASSAKEALRVLKHREIPFVVTDINMPGMDGISLLKEIKKEKPHVEVIIMTGKSTEEFAIEALRSGASDYFRKPIQGPEVIASLLRSQRMLEVRSQNRRLSALVSHLSNPERRTIHFGKSQGSRQLLSQLKKISGFPETTVLLTGETGVGKEVAARLLHQFSRPAGAPFVAINCAGIAESLLERELFGHEKGAFTGAEKRTPGVFEMGLEGTVLLDEITEMSLSGQSRLLRVLEARSFRRIGGTSEVFLNQTRIIATTNKDIESLVTEGRFREDLFFRLNVVPVHIPPLRERATEIPELARTFLQDLRPNTGLTFSPEAETVLKKHVYPGNLRELRNIVENAAIFSNGPSIEPSDLTLSTLPGAGGAGRASPEAPGSPATLNLEEAERRIIIQALKASPHNHSAAARALGITPQTLNRRLEKLSIDPP